MPAFKAGKARFVGKPIARPDVEPNSIGIPMILASLPIGATIVGLPLAATLFTVGWGFQFAGHAFEGTSPAFLSDKRSLVVGALWWAQKVGLPVHESAAA